MPRPAPPPAPAFQSEDSLFLLFQGDCNEVLPAFAETFDLIFAGPPYFLSSGGLSIQSGKVVCVNKQRSACAGYALLVLPQESQF